MAIRLKDFMNIQTGFFVFIVVVIIVVGMSMSSENNYLNPSGNRNPANQKLMVVDQDSGEISFIQKSLQGVNAQIVADDTVILNILKNLLGDNMNNYGGYTKSGNKGVISKIADAQQHDRDADDAKYATKTELAANRKLDDDRLASLEGSINGKIGNGEVIYLKSRSAKGGLLQNDCGWPGGDNCNARWGTGNDARVPTVADDPFATGHYIRKA